MLVPVGWKPVDVAPGGDTRKMEIRFFLKDNTKKPLYSAVWEYGTNLRKLVFVVPSTDQALGPLAFKFITEDRRILRAAQARKREG